MTEKKRGRPTKYGVSMKDYRVRLGTEHVETFRKIGKGNVSQGARTLAEAAQGDKLMDEKENGMTLIEILVVVTICMILCAVALTVYSRCQEPAKDQCGRERCRQVYLEALTDDPEHIALRQSLMSGRIYYQIPKTERLATYGADYNGRNANGPERHIAWYLDTPQEQITWDEEKIRR